MADVLTTAELLEEAREPLLEAIHHLGKALAIENHSPEPKEPTEVLSLPLASLLGEALPSLTTFSGDPNTSPAPAIKALKLPPILSEPIKESPFGESKIV